MASSAITSVRADRKGLAIFNGHEAALKATKARTRLDAIIYSIAVAICVALSGCGGGGYAGGGITSLSATSIVIDAGQSVGITSKVSGNFVVSWTLSGASCTGSACGTLSANSGAAVTYQAPAGISSQMQVTLVAMIQGTKSQETVSITVNPDPTLSGTPPTGIVGQAYSTKISSAGGTAPLTTSVQSGTLPPGLTYNSSSGVISGTPTSTGTFNFVLQLIDASAVPFKVTANETITIVDPVPPLTLIGGPQPIGEVGMAYATSLIAAGGVTPYSWSVVSGSLPGGLNISPTSGVISGTPTTAGTSNFTVQVKDSTGATATAAASITIVPALSLTGGPQPSGKVGVSYSTSLAAAGGITPYSWSIVSGTLPAGLTISSTSGLISGTPLSAGTQTFTVQVKDSDGATATAAASITIIAPLALTNTLPNGTVGVAYSATIGASGGVTPYSCSITGTLPAGLSLSGCTVSGTPTAAGSSTVVVKVTDSNNPVQSVSANEVIVIAPAALNMTNTLPNGTVGVAYSAFITASGGTTPYACSITGSLPAGLSLSGCTVSGTPTAAGSFPVTVKVTDASSPTQNVSANETVVISPAALALTNTLPNGTVGVTYTATITASGGTTPYSCSIAGTLPAGLSLSGCTVSGTPTAAGSSTVTVTVTDSGSPSQTASANETIVIAPAILALTGTLPDGTVGVPYSATIGATGGVMPYSCSITGTLPAGLSLTGCTVSGTPTATGSSTVTVKVTDSGSPTQNASALETIVIGPAALTLTSTLPDGTVGTPYSSAITASDGTAPYSCSITGTLPAGLSLSGCTVSGTPTTAGSSTVTVKVTDSGSPAQNVSGNQTIVISPAPLTLTGTLPNGTVGVTYTATIGASGGTSPYSCSITSGTLPSGLTLSGCTVSGTPTAAGSSTVTVKVTDAGSPAQSVSGNQTIVINPAPLTLTGSLPNGTVGVPYSATIGASGGTSPYTCSITGTLPSGLILTGCTVSGTPTTAGSSTVTVKVTDAGSPAQNASADETIIITPAPLTLTTSTLPDGTVGVPYSATIGASGGTSPYSCAITAGTLPDGLTISGCTVSGTPTTAGSSTVTVKVTDSESPAQTTSGPETIVIQPAALALTSTFPDGTVGVAYSTSITASGGTKPYSCSITAGTLPDGLTLSGCTVSGTPTTPGTSAITVSVTDSSSPVKSVSGNESITIHPSGALSLTGTLPNGTVGVAYSYTLHATGGTPPYSYALTAGSLPPGINLSSDGVISGTPTQAGASSFTVTVTDSAASPATASLPLILLIEYPTTPYDGELTGPYAFLFQGYDDVVAGVLAYHSDTVGSFTADGTGGISLGELDANHQASNPSGTTVATQNFLGTYEINSDGRGLITITSFNQDGTTDQTSTYAIALKSPVSPATVSTQGSLIEFDNDQLVGTKGSGTLLAQTTSAFTAGLNGNYAFGLSGDTPCLISCTVGVASGPVATVGQFSTDGAGNISGGSADADIASVNFANAPLTGSYQNADFNGRVQLQLTNMSISDGLYPSDFAVYLVNANKAFIMSTDKHSQYTLLAGTAQLQTSTSFSNASMNGAFVGYENAQSNPGLLGTTLQNVLNYSTSTIFRASGDGSGTCNTTNVDTAGLTSLVDSLSGLSGTTQSNLIEALLGSYGATGTSSCTVASNGRGTLDYPNHSGLISFLLGLLGLPAGNPPPRVIYLVAPNQGYFLETGYAGLGEFEPQTGAPFSLGTLDGTYVVGNVPASSLASINSSGYFTADGNGNATYTLDENIGVGTLNVLKLGTTGNTTYSLSDPNNNVSAATAGRYVLGDGTTVIYAISPDRFVEVDTNPLTTSPSVSLLY